MGAGTATRDVHPLMSSLRKAPRPTRRSGSAASDPQYLKLSDCSAPSSFSFSTSGNGNLVSTSFSPGGRAWIIRKLRANVFVDGTVSIRGSGLLLSGGDGIGTRGAVTQVSATLFCGGLAHDTGPADLDAAGNFQIRGPLSAAPPNPCNAPVLLIRNAAGTRAWFAAGIPGGED